MMVRALVPPIGFLLSIPLALWRPYLGEDSWALIGVALLLFRRLFLFRRLDNTSTSLEQGGPAGEGLTHDAPEPALDPTGYRT